MGFELRFSRKEINAWPGPLADHPAQASFGRTWDNPETCGHILKHFSHIFAEFLQRTATVRAATIYRQMLYRFTGQMIRQGLAFWFGRYGRL